MKGFESRRERRRWRGEPVRWTSERCASSGIWEIRGRSKGQGRRVEWMGRSWGSPFEEMASWEMKDGKSGVEGGEGRELGMVDQMCAVAC